MLCRHLYLLDVILCIYIYSFVCFNLSYYILLIIVTCIYQFAINTLYNSCYQVHVYHHIEILLECAYS